MYGLNKNRSSPRIHRRSPSPLLVWLNAAWVPGADEKGHFQRDMNDPCKLNDLKIYIHVMHPETFSSVMLKLVIFEHLPHRNIGKEWSRIELLYSNLGQLYLEVLAFSCTYRLQHIEATRDALRDQAALVFREVFTIVACEISQDSPIFCPTVIVAEQING